MRCCSARAGGPHERPPSPGWRRERPPAGPGRRRGGRRAGRGRRRAAGGAGRGARGGLRLRGGRGTPVRGQAEGGGAGLADPRSLPGRAGRHDHRPRGPAGGRGRRLPAPVPCQQRPGRRHRWRRSWRTGWPPPTSAWSRSVRPGCGCSGRGRWSRPRCGPPAGAAGPSPSRGWRHPPPASAALRAPSPGAIHPRPVIPRPGITVPAADRARGRLIPVAACSPAACRPGRTRGRVAPGPPPASGRAA